MTVSNFRYRIRSGVQKCGFIKQPLGVHVNTSSKIEIRRKLYSIIWISTWDLTGTWGKNIFTSICLTVFANRMRNFHPLFVQNEQNNKTLILQHSTKILFLKNGGMVGSAYSKRLYFEYMTCPSVTFLKMTKLLISNNKYFSFKVQSWRNLQRHKLTGMQPWLYWPERYYKWHSLWDVLHWTAIPHYEHYSTLLYPKLKKVLLLEYK